MKKTYSIALLSLSFALAAYPAECSMPYPIIWCSSAVLELVNMYSKDARHMIFGNNPINQTAQDYLQTLANESNIMLPEDIKQSRQVWPAMAGSIYSDHDTLFVSKDTCDQLQNGKITPQAKKDLISALLMINSHFDNKVVAAFIATPIIVWGAIYGLKQLMEKNEWKKNKWINKIATLTTLEKSFISLCIIEAFVLYQRWAISKQVQLLIQ